MRGFRDENVNNYSSECVISQSKKKSNSNRIFSSSYVADLEIISALLLLGQTSFSCTKGKVFCADTDI